MAGRTRSNEGVVGFLVHYFVDRLHAAADAAQCRLEAAWRHRGVGVDLHQSLRGRCFLNRLDVFHRMHQRDGFERGLRRLDARQRLEALIFERLFDGAQPVRPLRMAGRCQMIEAGRVRDEKRGHKRVLTRSGATANRHQAFAFRFTPGGGGMLSGTKKSRCRG